ncbi:hypothetical protein [Halobellus rufus]|uniref:hypothetical protein n=1 Tax=Halobellus rufus TaxID=1448860 RepID=UPI0006793441|nr:hypothetical protein [Halobellus rufus]
MTTRRPTTIGRTVIVPHGHRPLLGTIREADPEPLFHDPGRTVLTVDVDELETSVRCLAQNAEPAD